MEWGILIMFFLLFGAILAVLAKAIVDDIATVDDAKASKVQQRQATGSSGGKG